MFEKREPVKSLLFHVCFDFSIIDNIKSNPVKSVYIVIFKPKK